MLEDPKLPKSTEDFLEEITTLPADAREQTPVVIWGRDRNDTLEEDDIAVFFRSGSTDPKEVALERLRTILAPSDSPVEQTWRRMDSNDMPANLVHGKVYYTDITPDSDSTWLLIAPLYAAGNGNQRGANFGRVLYSEWAAGTAVSTADEGTPDTGGGDSSHAYQYIEAGVWGSDFGSATKPPDQLHVGRTANGQLAILFYQGSNNLAPHMQGVRLIEE